MRADPMKKLIAGLKPKDKPFEHADPNQPGLIIRMQPSGRASYYVVLGRGRRVALGPHPDVTLEMARSRAQKARVEAESGAGNAEIKAVVRPRSVAVMTLGKFLNDTYADWLAANLKTGAAEAARLRSSFADWLDVPLAELTPARYERWKTARLQAGRTLASVNRDANAIRACLNRAVEWGHLPSYPLGQFKRKKADDNAIVRYLSPTEEIALRAALERRDTRLRDERARGNAWREERGYELLPERDGRYGDYLSPAVLIALNTGLRRGELFSLTWPCVDFDKGTITALGKFAKSGKTRHLPASEEARDVLTAWREQTDGNGLVFPNRDGDRFGSLKKSWAAVLADAGIVEFRWHDLRHSFASKLVQAGVSLNVVRELLGHADLALTLRYAHLAPDNLGEAIKAMRPAAAEARP